MLHKLSVSLQTKELGTYKREESLLQNLYQLLDVRQWLIMKKELVHHGTKNILKL